MSITVTEVAGVIFATSSKCPSKVALSCKLSGAASWRLGGISISPTGSRLAASYTVITSVRLPRVPREKNVSPVKMRDGQATLPRSRSCRSSASR